MHASEAALPLDLLVEVAFPAWPPPLPFARAVAPAAPRSWATQREAGAAAATVAGLVGVPALIAIGAAATTFVLTVAVLAAPAVAFVLAAIAWRCNRVTGPPARAGHPASRSGTE